MTVLEFLVVVGVLFAMHSLTAWHLQRMQRDQHGLIERMNLQLDDARKMTASRDYAHFAAAKAREAEAEAKAKSGEIELTPSEVERIADAELHRRAFNMPHSALD